MSKTTIAIIIAAGAGAYVLTRKAGSGNSILGSLGGLFGGPPVVDIPTNGTLAGTTGWDGSINTSGTSYGPADPSAFELGSIFGSY